MDSFGGELRKLRLASGLRQADVVELLGGTITRASLANIEMGREAPTEPVWQALRSWLPEWSDSLGNLYEAARGDVLRAQVFSGTRAGNAVVTSDDLGGPFVLHAVNYTYVFGHSRSPEEIIEVRRLEALEAGARSFGLWFAHRSSADFALAQEALWGGRLGEHQVRREDGSTVWLRRFDFGRVLDKGQSHEFAIRSWIEADSEPQHAVCFDLTIPAHEVAINLIFNGPRAPRKFWAYELREGVTGPTEDVPPMDPGDPAWLHADETGHVHRSWHAPDLGVVYGVAWAW